MNISEIAQLAGVSKAAVSRYLNNGYLSEEKRERIGKVIEETGYHPSAQAQTLRTNKTKLIGVVLPKISSETISRIVAGISLVLNENGYQLLLANTENDTEKEVEYLDIFRHNRVDGIIFIATIFTQRHQSILRSIHIPVVIVGQRRDGYACVYHDDFGAAKELTALMLASGRRRLAYLGVTIKDQAAGLRRREGFLAAAQEANVRVPPTRMREADFSMESGYVRAQALFAADPSVDCLFCATDNIAIGAIAWLKETGKRVPQDVLVTGTGDTRLGRVATPSLTTAHFYYKTSGQRAAEMLLDCLKKPQAGKQALQMGYRLIERESTAETVQATDEKTETM